MELHPLARGFADVADVYERGRPGYPAEAIAAIGLPAGARVADVGAGTGKLTRALLAAGLDVVAVEPLDGMRARLVAELPAVEALAGTAEALPLPDASVDAVACGDSFHWFDPQRAAPELARVIRPGGTLAILCNTPARHAEVPWGAELRELLESIRPEHPGFDGDRERRGTFGATDSFTPLERSEFANVHATDRAGLLANIASISFVALLPADRRTALLDRVDAVLREHGVERFDLPLRTEVSTARRLGRR
jgi:SAM-dependent methyltransferase